MRTLFEQYRPTRFEDVVGQDEAVAQIRAVLRRGWGGRAWWITGASGTGKTTLARLIAAEGASEFGTEEIDAGTLTPAKVHELERDMHYRAMADKPGKAYLVNEAHGLRRDTIRLLLVLLERLPEHVAVIFTTTKDGQGLLFENSEDTAPLLSRCVEVELANGTATRRAMARRAREIAQHEGIDGLPEDVYFRAADDCRGNMRRLLQRVESGAIGADARKRQLLERELGMLGSTKGDRAEKRRAELREALGLAE